MFKVINMSNKLKIYVDEVMWDNHPEKEIEYFCNDCKLLVCSRWMFLEHNGHNLSLLDDILPKLEKEMSNQFSRSEEASERISNYFNLL